MLIAVAGIAIQIATGVDYPPVPPGPIILLAASALVVYRPGRRSAIIGVIIPLFLLVGGTLASLSNDALWQSDEPGQFAGLTIQVIGELIALVAGIHALRSRRVR
jgi:hypothetical protein